MRKEKLKYVFSIVNEQLRFAETKNTGLAAMNVVALFGILQSNKGSDDPLVLAMLFFIVSLGFNLYSILPEIGKHFKYYKKENQHEFSTNMDKYNVIFFVDLARLSSEQLIQLVDYKLGLNDSVTFDERDLGSQIINNSEIARRKFVLFKFGGYLALCGMVCVIIEVFNYTFFK